MRFYHPAFSALHYPCMLLPLPTSRAGLRFHCHTALTLPPISIADPALRRYVAPGPIDAPACAFLFRIELDQETALPSAIFIPEQPLDRLDATLSTIPLPEQRISLLPLVIHPAASHPRFPTHFGYRRWYFGCPAKRCPRAAPPRHRLLYLRPETLKPEDRSRDGVRAGIHSRAPARAPAALLRCADCLNLERPSHWARRARNRPLPVTGPFGALAAWVEWEREHGDLARAIGTG